MTRFVVLPAAEARIGEIYLYSHATWGEARAQTYIRGLFAAFETIASGKAPPRRAPPYLGFDGHVFRYGRHYIYWRYLEGGDIGIVSVLHESMHQKARLRGDLKP